MTMLQFLHAIRDRIHADQLGQAELTGWQVTIHRVRAATSADIAPYTYTATPVGDTDEVDLRHAMGRRLGRANTVDGVMALLAGESPPRAAVDPTIAFPEGAQVQVVGPGKYSGRVGTVVKVAVPPFTEYRYVLLDLRPRERVQKREFLAITSLAPLESPDAR